jgi:hypothetical protein
VRCKKEGKHVDFTTNMSRLLIVSSPCQQLIGVILLTVMLIMLIFKQLGHEHPHGLRGRNVCGFGGAFFAALAFVVFWLGMADQAPYPFYTKRNDHLVNFPNAG